MVGKGWGVEKPIAPNDTEENREKNRRVEFLVIEQDITQKKVEIDPTTGKEKVVETKTESVKAPEAPATDAHAKPEPNAKPGEKPAEKPAAPAKPGAKTTTTATKPASPAAPKAPASATSATPATPKPAEKK